MSIKPLKQILIVAEQNKFVCLFVYYSILLFNPSNLIKFFVKPSSPFFIKVKDFEKYIKTLATEIDSRWLLDNSGERMDATLDVFEGSRADFHLERYNFAGKYIKDLKIADIACGTGYGSKLMVKKYKAKSCLGIDIDQGTINYAISKHLLPNITFKCTSGDDTKLDSESIDVVVSFETIEHVPDDYKLVKEFNRILKKGGKLICSTPNGWELEDAPYHLRVYNLENFTKVLSEYFNIIEFYNQNSGEGKYNRGQNAGIYRTTENNFEFAECFIAICEKK